MTQFERDVLDRYCNKRPLSSRSEYTDLHTAAIDTFVVSKQHGRELWNLHFQADVKVAERTDELTRIQTLVLQQLDAYWSEKAREKSRKKQSRGSRFPS